MTFIKCFLILCTFAAITIAINNADNLFWFIPAVVIIVIIAGVCWHHIQKREEQNKIDQQQEKQSNDLLERRTRKIELLEKLKNSQNPSWSDIVDASEFGFSYDAKALYEIIASANVMDLITVSNIKMQLYWKNGSLSVPLTAIDSVFENCFDDRILMRLIEQFKKIDEIQGYNGYNTLTNVITNYKHIAKYVQFKSKSFSQPQLN